MPSGGAAVALNAFRVALTDALRPLADPVEIQSTASRILGERLGASRVAYFEVRGADYVIARDFADGTTTIAGSYAIASFGEQLLASLTSGQTVVCNDVVNDAALTAPMRAAYLAIQIGSHIGVPLIKGGQLVAGLAVHSRRPREWAPEEAALVEETAERTWAAVERARSEQALRESEEKYRSLFEMMDEGFCLCELLVDPSGRPVDYRFLEVNSLFEQQTGLLAAAGKTALELVPGLEAHWIELYGKVALTGEPARFQQGSEAMGRWFDVRAYRVGAPRHRKFAILFQDITERRKAELQLAGALADLRDSKLRFDLVKDGAQVGFWFCDLPFDKLIWDNRVKEHFWMPPDAEVTIDTFYERLHPADRERTRQAIEASIANRTQYNIEYRTLSAIGAEKWIRAIGRTFYDAQGGPIRFDGVTLDITARRRMEDAVRESEERFRNMADHAPVMIWMTDAAASCTYLSESWYTFTGQAPETALGLGWLDATHPDDRADADEIFLGANERHEAFRLDYRLRRADGSYAWAIDSATPRFGPDGEFLGYIGSVLDITERKHMEDALKENDRRKDEFLAMLAHELRNPLAPIRHAAEVLKVTTPGDPNQQWARGVIERQTQHITRLVDDLLDVSRIARGKITLRPERFAVASVIERAVEAIRPVAEGRRQSLSVALPSASLEVEGDVTRLVQVLSNLLSNASKFNHDGGQISVTAAQEGTQVAIRVADDGIGIPAELMPRVFELFTQSDRSLDRSQGGLGIGLTLVRLLVDQHGGTVEARSDGPGRGSEFVVRLPLAAADGTTTRAVAAAAVPAPAARPAKRVLVVEDNEDAAETLRMILALHGYEVEVAYDGPSAIEAAPRFQPQVMVCDIGLPNMNGYEVARQVRALPNVERPTLIALSGYGQEEDRRRGREAGFDYHLVKPVEPHALFALLDSLPD